MACCTVTKELSKNSAENVFEYRIPHSDVKRVPHRKVGPLVSQQVAAVEIRDNDMFDDFLFNNEPKNSPHVISLFNAASKNQLEKLNSILISYPAVKLHENVNGLNCILIASKKGHLQIVKRIHHCYPEIISSRTSDNRRSSLMLAAFEGHETVANYLSEFEVG